MLPTGRYTIAAVSVRVEYVMAPNGCYEESGCHDNISLSYRSSVYLVIRDAIKTSFGGHMESTSN